MINTMINYYFGAHKVDVDGIACHVMAKKRLNPEHIFLDFPNLITELTKLESKPPGNIILADLALSGNNDVNEVLQNLSEEHTLEALYDHHVWDMQDPILKLFEESRIEYHPGTDKQMCAAKIVIEEFSLKNDSNSQILADLSYVSDFQIKEDELYQTAVDIQKAITLTNLGKAKTLNGQRVLTLDELVSSLSTRAWNNPVIEILSTSYDKMSEEAQQQLEASIIKKEIKGKTVYFGFSDPMFYLKEASYHLRKKHPEADVVITIFSNSHVAGSVNMLGPEEKEIPIVEYAKSFGGGGRDNAGGFRVNPSELKDKQAFVDKLSKRLEQYIKE